MSNRRKQYEKARNIRRNNVAKKFKRLASPYGLDTGKAISAAKHTALRLGRRWFSSKHRPHQGAQECARRVLKGRITNPLVHGRKWASWKKGRECKVIDGVVVLIPTP